ILTVIAHEHGHLVRRGRMMLANANICIPPAPGPFRAKVACDLMVEFENDFRKVGLRGKPLLRNVLFGAQNPRRQQWGEFSVAQEAAGCLDIARGAARRCSVWSHDNSTGSHS